METTEISLAAESGPLHFFLVVLKSLPVEASKGEVGEGLQGFGELAPRRLHLPKGSYDWDNSETSHARPQ